MAKHKCSRCGKIFQSGSSAVQHIAAKHGGKALDSICMWPDAYRHLYAMVQAETAPKGENNERL